MRRPALLLCAALGGCPPANGDLATTGTGETTDLSTSETSESPTSESPTSGSSSTTGAGDECPESGAGRMLDVLFVVDNSYSTIARKQVRLVAGMPHLLARLRALDTDVNIMFTTTDVGHPLCTVSQNVGYYPARGEPTASPCSERLSHFDDITGVIDGAAFCQAVCPDAAAPGDPFIHFAGADHNVIDADGAGDPVTDALACVAPQGFVGCSMEAPLEAMLLALDRDKPWNRGERPFLRDCAALAIVVFTDETDCSVAEAGYRYFDPEEIDDPEYNLYMEDVPGMPGVKDRPTSAVCWNAGMACEDPDGDGVQTCTPVDRGVLQPTWRYVDLLQGLAAGAAARPVFMLAITGVPASGERDLVYHDWTDADLLPGELASAADLQHSFGIGPGCSLASTGYAIPPGRIAEVCHALDADDRQRCCVASICTDDHSGAFDCLADMLADQT